MTNFNQLCETFKEHIWYPEDYTDRFYYWRSGELHWCEEFEEDTDPNNWEDCYSTDRVREVEEIGDYFIATLDDGCGGRYQAIFDKRKEVK